MSAASRLIVATLALTSIATASSAAALTILSSDRSASATAHAHDGTHLLPPGTPPANPLLTASNSTNSPGPFNFDTGTLSAWGRAVRPGSPPNQWVPAGQTAASASALFTSALSPPDGLSAASALTAGGHGAESYGADADAQTRYVVSFTVDVPTPFTLTGNYNVPSRSPDASSIDGNYWIEVKLTDHLNVDLTGRVRDGVHPTPFAISGTFRPGTTYTLETELRLQVVHRNLGSFYDTGGSMNFSLSVPEPTSCLLPVAALIAAFRRSR